LERLERRKDPHKDNHLSTSILSDLSKLERKMTTTDDFRKRALEGDGLFAIAYALMALREDLCFGDGSSRRTQGTLEVLAMGMRDLATAADEIASALDRDQ
jgi:hypothetical protein